jgi:hypothetical protein
LEVAITAVTKIRRLPEVVAAPSPAGRIDGRSHSLTRQDDVDEHAARLQKAKYLFLGTRENDPVAMVEAAGTNAFAETETAAFEKHRVRGVRFPVAEP